MYLWVTGCTPRRDWRKDKAALLVAIGAPTDGRKVPPPTPRSSTKSTSCPGARARFPRTSSAGNTPTTTSGLTSRSANALRPSFSPMLMYSLDPVLCLIAPERTERIQSLAPQPERVSYSSQGTRMKNHGLNTTASQPWERFGNSESAVPLQPSATRRGARLTSFTAFRADRGARPLLFMKTRSRTSPPIVPSSQNRAQSVTRCRLSSEQRAGSISACADACMDHYQVVDCPLFRILPPTASP